MSAFFIAINRNGHPFDKKVAVAMMRQLDGFGVDSKQLIVSDHYAIGFQAHWTVPEELGERQPLKLSDEHWFIFYGRLDNRETIIRQLEEAAPEQYESSANLLEKRSDAVLAQLYFECYGVSKLQNLIGPFVLADFNVANELLVIARDGMGARCVSYAIHRDYVVAASYEMALVAHPAVDYRLNDETVSRHLINQMQNGSTSMIDGLEVLAPGHALEVDRESYQLKRFYRPDPKHRIVFNTDEEYATEFRRLLDQSVSRRMRCTANIGTQLSGGLDSVPMTILAAQLLNSGSVNSVNSKLQAYSWVFDNYPQADERRFSQPICTKFHIDQHTVNCDDLWFAYPNNKDLDPLGPTYNPFMRYNQALFEKAQSHSVNVMLTGIHGDILYLYTHGILYELLKAGEFKALLQEAKSLLFNSVSAWSFFKTNILKPLFVVDRWLIRRARKTSLATQILQPRIAKKLISQKPRDQFLIDESRHALRPQQWQVVLGGFAGGDAAAGRFLESEYDIERRYPFRDRDLCEFMLAIPSRLLAFKAASRPIVKRAFATELPKKMLARNQKAYFADVTLAGLRNDSTNKNWANGGSRHWSYYVKECYFDSKVEQNHSLELVKWRCGYYDYWRSICYYPRAKNLGLSDET